MLAKENEDILSAVGTVYQLSREQQIRQQCEARMDYYKREGDRRRRDAMAAEREKRLEEKERMLEEKERALKQKDRIQEEKERAQEEKDRKLKEKEQQVEKKEQQVEKRLKEEKVKSVIEALQEYGIDDNEIQGTIMKQFHLDEEELKAFL